jgi:hypothetical protein
MPPSKEHLAHPQALHEFAAELRGKFLNGSAWIETLLGDILATYFCGDSERRGLFFSEVANDMRLSSKATLLDKILEREFPQLRKSVSTPEAALGLGAQVSQSFGTRTRRYLGGRASSEKERRSDLYLL